jgi:hypothetical protein
VTATSVGHPYVPERQTEYWSSRQIEGFFWDLGYECLSFPISPRAEKLIPADFIFFPSDTLKLFGLQYKSLYRGTPDYWNVDPTQRSQLIKFGWIYYALSEIRATRKLRAALHALRIPLSPPPPGVLTLPSAASSPYARWWAFFEQLRSCQQGILASSRDEFINVFAPVADSPLASREADNAADIFLVNLNRSRLVRFTSSIAPEIRSTQ